MEGILTAITREGYIVTVGPGVTALVHPSYEAKKDIKIGDRVYLEISERTGKIKSVTKMKEESK